MKPAGDPLPLAPELRELLAANLPERLRPLMEACLGKHSKAARIRAARSTLEAADQATRDEVGRWVAQAVPVHLLVPDVYAQWRPVVRDAVEFVFSRLSASRLATKLVEQVDLPLETAPGTRLLLLISEMPGIQKMGQVIARHRHLGDPLRHALAELENGMSDMRAASIRSIIQRQLGTRLRKHAVKFGSRHLMRSERERHRAIHLAQSGHWKARAGCIQDSQALRGALLRRGSQAASGIERVFGRPAAGMDSRLKTSPKWWPKWACCWNMNWTS